MVRKNNPTADSDTSDAIVNQSGFPFQLAVEERIKQTAHNHGWVVLSHEHPYRDQRSDDDGYIDIMLENGRRA